MTKTIFAVIFTIISLSATASANGPLGTHFDTLGDLFKAGSMPDISKIKKIPWSGRCFTEARPNKPVNAGYFLREKASADVGPIGSINKIYEAASYWQRSEAPNFFDDKDSSFVLDWIQNGNISWIDAKLKQTSIEISLPDGNKSNLRASGNYLVEEVSGAKSDAGPLGKDVKVRCYFFIPEYQ